MTASLIHDRLDSLTLGEGTAFQQLSIHPLLASAWSERDYLTLDEALKQGQVLISEVSEHGSVPELLLRNGSATSVLLIDGEELVGAKQNRVLNLSILAPAMSELRIPVSCVEAGRWQHNSRHFRTEGRAFFAEGRARKASKVTESMQEQAAFRSDQNEVWEAIAMKSARMGSRSPTSAMSSLYQDHELLLSQYLDAFRVRPAQVGAVFVVGGVVKGIEAFDSPDTFAALFPKLLKSYALDALEARPRSAHEREEHAFMDITGAPPSTSAEERAQLLAALEGLKTEEVSRHKAAGEGDDYRLAGRHAAGGALHARGRIVHLYAFPQAHPQPPLC